jgi:AcrR family transcriptional regulator
MPRPLGLRERKKLEQRQRIADVAAELFAERGYDAVSMSDVAEAADVSYQTVYNYFPAKPDLVLDRADAFRELYERTVRERPAGTSPAEALRPLVEAGVVRFRSSDVRLGRGQYPALCVGSVVIRGFALLARERDAEAIAGAITATTPAMHPLVAHAHAAALIAVVQAISDRIGAGVLTGEVSEEAADGMTRDAAAAFDELDRQFRAATTTSTAA